MASGKKDNYGLHKDISSIFQGVSVPEHSCSSRPVRESKEPAPEKKTANPVLTPAAPKPAAPVARPQGKPKPQATQGDMKPGPKGIEVVAISKAGPLTALKNKLFAPKPGVSPTRQKAVVMMVPLLTIVFIYVITQVFGATPRVTKAKTKDDPLTAKARVSEIEWQVPEPYPANLRDPMTFGPTQEDDPVGIETATNSQGIRQIKGILYSKDNPSAIIGSSIVHEGDTVDGVKVVRINEKSVEFEADGKTWTQEVQR